MKDFIDVVKNRKSIRSFLNVRVDRATVEDILTCATYAPTSCNQQLWNFVVVEDAAMKERLIREAAANTLVRRTPVIVVMTYDGWNYKEAIQGASLAVGNVLLAAEYYGLGALPMNSYGADNKIKEILGIPSSETICCFVALGYSDDVAQALPLVPRRRLSEVVHWGKFEGKKLIPFTYSPDYWSLDNLRNHQKHYCRKTFLGKEMDIFNTLERNLVKLSLSKINGSAIDLFPYDGSFLKEFPDISLLALDLTDATSDYVKAAVSFSTKQRNTPISYGIYDEERKALSDISVAAVTLIYKLERLSASVADRLFVQAYSVLQENGELIIISRKTNIFLSFFFFIIKMLFGKDVRRTGIFAFFGPYQPINVRKIKKQLKAAGFQEIMLEEYFLFPAFYEELHQMFLQFIRSGGSSYLHRERQQNFISRFLSFVLKIQGFQKVGPFGSVVVMKCRK